MIEKEEKMGATYALDEALVARWRLPEDTPAEVRRKLIEEQYQRNMAGFVAAGLLRGDHPQVDIATLLALPAEERPLILDVRTAQEHQQGAIPGAVNIPIDVLRDRWDELPPNREIATYCQVGQRGYLATRILRQKGLTVSNISGGYKSYCLHQ